MPLARIFTRPEDNPSELRARLETLGFEVETMRPGDLAPARPADLEIRLEQCTPSEALSFASAMLSNSGQLSTEKVDLNDDSPREPLSHTQGVPPDSQGKPDGAPEVYLYEDAVLFSLPSWLRGARLRQHVENLHSRVRLWRLPQLPAMPRQKFRIPRPQFNRVRLPRVRVPRPQLPHLRLPDTTPYIARTRLWVSGLRLGNRLARARHYRPAWPARAAAQFQLLLRRAKYATAANYRNLRYYANRPWWLRRTKGSAKISLPKIMIPPPIEPRRLSSHTFRLRRPPTRSGFWDSALAFGILAVCALFTGSLLHTRSPLPAEIVGASQGARQQVPFVHASNSSAATSNAEGPVSPPAPAMKVASSGESASASRADVVHSRFASAIAKHVHPANLTSKVFHSEDGSDEVIIHYFHQPQPAPTAIASDGIKHYSDLH